MDNGYLLLFFVIIRRHMKLVFFIILNIFALVASDTVSTVSLGYLL